VLDVGCGADRVGIYLQNEKKLDVLGIDNSPACDQGIETARPEESKTARFSQNNVPSLVLRYRRDV